ncbi:MAG: RnfH family protein [Gammaproteobacteria bacterium]
MNEGPAKIWVEVAWGWPDRQRVVSLQVAADTTAREVVLAAGLAEDFDGLDPASMPLAVFGAEVADSYALQSGDRVDLLRPLLRDPRDARRDLAARGKTIAARPADDEV